MVVRILKANTQAAQESISRLAAGMDSWAGEFTAHHALRDALITDRARVSLTARDALRPIVGKYLD
jgi:hypothetical protein